MENMPLNPKVLQAIQEFETLGDIEPSADWDKILIQKMKARQQTNSASNSRSNVWMVVILIINVAFAYKVFTTQTTQKGQRTDDLQLVSRELLINPISINN